MKHHKSIRKFGRTRNQRTALLRSLALALLTRGKIRTTEAKAKELRPFVEKLVTRSRVGTVASRRVVSAKLGGGSAAAVGKLFREIGPRYAGRAGGYTRIVKMPARRTDGSLMAVIEFV